MLRELTHAVSPRLWWNSSSHSTLSTPRAICEPMIRMCTKKEERTITQAHRPSMSGWGLSVFLSLGSSSRSYPISSWLVYIFQGFLKYTGEVISLNIKTKKYLHLLGPALPLRLNSSGPIIMSDLQRNRRHYADLGTCLTFSQDQIYSHPVCKNCNPYLKKMKIQEGGNFPKVSWLW